MNTRLLLGLALGAAVVIGNERAAEACGGCFHGPPLPNESPGVVTDHRMVFSISKTQSTLYDQIRYSGKPESFAWVLPFVGDIEVGVSSDELFNALDQQTRTQIFAPPYPCSPAPFCGSSSGFSSASSSSGSAGNFYDAGVSVLHQEVVGPYETVQLKATDPQALEKWLADHGYTIADSVKPVIAKYEAENFNFLAVKLVPGKNVQSMKPIRVTTQGSNVALPLRMVAAGTGATVGITLWIVAEGRYEPSNFGSFLIRDTDLTWDWSSSSSDYVKQRADRTAAAQGRTWEVESVTPSLRTSITSTVSSLVSVAYEDQKTDAGIVTQTAQAAYVEDMETLFAGIAPGAEKITRLRADLAHSALDQDLTLKASASQEDVPAIRYITKAVNVPICPTYPPCPSSSGANGSGGIIISDAGSGKAAPENNDDDGCRTSPGTSSAPWLGVLVAAGLIAAARKKKEQA